MAFLIYACATPTKTKTVKTNINVSITSHLGDNQTFRKGDSLYYFLSLDQKAYVLLIYETAEKQIIQIFPNKFVQKKTFDAVNFYRIPDKSMPLSFEVSEPFGRESIWVFAADVPFPHTPGKETENGLKVLAVQNMLSLKKRLENISIQENTSFGWDRATIITVE